MRRAIFIIALIVAVVVVGLGFMNALNAQTTEGASNAAIMAKLSEILNNQQAIIQRLDDMKSELHIIQIRASRK